MTPAPFGEDSAEQQHNHRKVSWLRALLRVPGWLVILLVKILYQKMISPCLPKVCIYEPSCSNYMIEAIQVHGLLKGGLLGCWRILRCHPFAKGGSDPVPLRHHWRFVPEQEPEQVGTHEDECGDCDRSRPEDSAP